MSLFVPMNLTCPECASVFTYEAVGSVNADRRPDLRDEILADEFQTVTCGDCSHSFRLEPDFNYLDVARQQWIAAMPASQLRDHLDITAEKRAVFELSYGAEAPAAAQSVGRDLHQRLVFGWPALREKLVLQEIGFDDALWEVAKLDLLRQLPAAPMAEGVELRLLGLNAELLELAWINASSEEHLNDFQVERGLYDHIASDPAPWQAVQALLASSAFVDIQKLFMGEGGAA